MDYLKVVNWEKFQQYKDREPKWIKVYRSLLTKYEFNKLPDIAKGHLVLIWLLAAQLDNRIPNDAVWIKEQIHSQKKPDVKTLVSAGFLESYSEDGEAVQNCTDLYIEKSREEEIREEIEKNIYMDFVKLSTEEHSKLLEQFGEAGLKERLAALNDYVGSRGVKYKSHYHTLLAWERKNGPRQPTGEHKQCLTRGCKNEGPASRTDDTGQKYYLCPACGGG